MPAYDDGGKENVETKNKIMHVYYVADHVMLVNVFVCCNQIGYEPLVIINLQE